MATRALLITTLGALLAFPAFPQDDNAPPPGRVARLGYFTGTVSFQPASIDDWSPAELNHPVTNGDHIWTEADGLVELQTDNASIRLGGRTNFSFLNLTDQVTQIEITTGILEVRLHTLAPEEGFEIDTPQLSFTLLRNGDYRVDVNENGDTTITTVRAGDAEINIGDKATRVPLGTQVIATGGDNPTLNGPNPAPALDQFDAFCADRDRREEAVVSANYVSRDMPGYADLDQYGVWRTVLPFGPVWFPAGLIADWAPYRYGHWGWVEPWGWTWIDDAPWGWTPFHFGRWILVGGAWGWVPTTPITVIRPVFAPALVAFADFDPGVVVADAAIGWVPLAVGEIYVPPFAVGVGVVGLAAFNFGISIGAGFDIGGGVAVGGLANAGAVTSMRHDDFDHGRHLHGDHLRADRRAMERAHGRHDAGRAPNRDAVRGFRGDARGHVPPRGVAGRGVQSHRAVPNRPASFEHGAASRAAHPGRPAGHSERAGGARPNTRGGENRGGMNRGGNGNRGGESRGGMNRGGGNANRGGGINRGGGNVNRGGGSGGRSNGPGSRGPATGGSRGPATGASRGPATGGSRGPATGGSRGPATGGSRGPATGGSRGPMTGGSRGPMTGAPSGSRGPSTPSRPQGGLPNGGRSSGPPNGTPGASRGPAMPGRPQGGLPNGRPGGPGTTGAGGRAAGSPAFGGRPGAPGGNGGRPGAPGGNPGFGGRPGGGNPGFGGRPGGGNPGLGSRPGGGNPGLGGRPGGGNPGLGGRPGGAPGRPGGVAPKPVPAPKKK